MIDVTVARTALKKQISERIIGKSLLATVKAYISLTKPRIMLLLLFTAFCAMIMAKGRMPDLQELIYALGGLALSTGGAAALNMWYDRDIDLVMQRTSKRPIPLGIIKPRHAFWFGILLEAVSVLILARFVNWYTAILSLAGFLYYVVIYTMWLKRRTPQNIVIGGGAGAFPPLVGFAAVTGHLNLTAWVLFLIVFFWTPPHFWALALYKNSDYQMANIPMMPVIHGARFTKWNSLIYTILLMLISLLPILNAPMNQIYLAVVLTAGLVFIGLGVLVLFEKEDEMVWAKRTFKYSLLYLPIIFIMMTLNFIS